MCFTSFRKLSCSNLFCFVLLLIAYPLAHAEEALPDVSSQQITLESQHSYQGACNKLVIAGSDQTGVCGQSLVIITMTNGSVSITIQQSNQDLGLFGAETNANLYSIYGAFVNGTDNIPLQGSCEQVSMINNDSVLVCAMTDEQGSPWEIQFTIIPD